MLRGVILDQNKDMSITNEVVDMCNPKVVYIPLVNYTDMNCKCLIKEGKKVKKGTVIGMREDIGLPIISSISGTVVDIRKNLYLNGKTVNCVVIENDGKEKEIKKTIVDDITAYSKEGFIEILKECAVTGMSGNDFPTFLKYQEDLNTLIVNAVECEPYVTSDLMIVKLKVREILETIDAIMKINNIKEAFIAVSEDNDIVINVFERYMRGYHNIKIIALENIFPMGWERYIIKSILKKNYKKLPSEIGVVVNNVSTIFEIYKALKFQRAISKRIITITGEMFKEPVNVLVKIGTKMRDVIRELGGYSETDNIKLIAGGLMMGISLPSDEVIATKNLNCILVVEDIDEYDEITCMRCGRCDNICPARISPVLIRSNLDDKEELLKLEPNRCIECGLCSYVCPSKIDLRTCVKTAKREVK